MGSDENMNTPFLAEKPSDPIENSTIINLLIPRRNPHFSVGLTTGTAARVVDALAVGADLTFRTAEGLDDPARLEPAHRALRAIHAGLAVAAHATLTHAAV